MNLEDNENLKTIIEAAPIGICILDAATLKAELLNDKFVEIAGKPLEAILGKYYWEPFAEARALYEDALNKVIATGVAFHAEEADVMLIRHGKEDYIHVTFVYAPVKNQLGVLTKVAVWVLENTQQVNEQRIITANEARLRALVTATSDVIYSLSANWEIMRQLDGRGFLKDTQAPMRGWRKQNVHAEHMEMVNAAINAAIRSKSIFELEHKVNRADGTPGWTLSKAVPILDDQGEIVEWFGIASDITHRKLVEEALSQTSDEMLAINEELASTNEEQATSNEELTMTNAELAHVNQQLRDAQQRIEDSEIALRLALEAANFGTWFIHSVTREFITDARLKELFGYYPDEPLSIEQAIAQITDDYRAYVAAKLENAIYNEGDYDVTYSVIGLHDKRLRWLRAVGNLKTDPSGTYSAFTGVVMDVTEQKTDELRKNDFIGMVSHELKTPLTSLHAILQVLSVKLQKNNDPFVPGAVEKANIQVKKMSTMINGFLNVSRLESGKISIDKQPFIIRDLIKEVIEENDAMGTTHIIQLEECDQVIVHADRDKIASVLNNFLSNAIKYSPKGSAIQISCDQINDEVQLSVKDEGAGIRPEDLKYIFDRYYRVQDKNTRHISGFGIGLYLSAEIVKHHQGRIWAESESGKGSTFYFTLPLN